MDFPLKISLKSFLCHLIFVNCENFFRHVLNMSVERHPLFLLFSVRLRLDADYVRTAYSRGNSTRRVMYHHVLKNALIPVLTFWGMTIADIVANSIILEQVFSIPGMGNLLITSISNRDYPVVQGILVLIAALIIIINFVVDLLYGRIDPRIRVKD